jgi:hypothetical protein
MLTALLVLWTVLGVLCLSLVGVAWLEDGTPDADPPPHVPTAEEQAREAYVREEITLEQFQQIVTQSLNS